MMERFWIRAAALVLALLVVLCPFAMASEEERVILSQELEGSPEKVRDSSTPLTRVLSAALREGTGAEFSIVPAGLVKASLPVGRVTLAQMEAALEPDWKVYTTHMNGVQLKRIINDAVYTLTRSENFPLVGGQELVLAPTRRDGDVPGAYVLGMGIDGAAIDETYEYLLVTVQPDTPVYDFPHPLEDAGMTAPQAMMDYLSRHTPQEIAAVSEAVELTWQDVESVAPQKFDKVLYAAGIGALLVLAGIVIGVPLYRKHLAKRYIV